MTIIGDLDINYVQAALLEVFLLWRIPSNIEEILVIDDPAHYSKIEKYIPKEIRKEFREAYAEDPTSMSLTWKKFDLIIISISKRDEAYLKKDKMALTGLFAHELMHIDLRRRGLDTQIRKDAIEAFKIFSPKLNRLTQYSTKEVVKLFSQVGRVANFVLKDIYANSKLIDLGLGPYLLSDYKGLYGSKKTCPTNIFSYDLKKKTDITLEQARPAFVFELQLLPAIVPFIRMYRQHKSKQKEVKELVDYIGDCYEINAKEIAKAYDKLIQFAADNVKDTPQFRRKFYSMLFNIIYDIIK